MVVAGAQAERARAVLEAALGGASLRGEVELPPAQTPVTLVSLVAEAMGQWPNVAGRFFAALGNVGINVLAIAQGASSRSISCVVAPPTPPRRSGPSTPPSTSPRPR